MSTVISPRSPTMLSNRCRNRPASTMPPCATRWLSAVRKHINETHGKKPVTDVHVVRV